MLCDVYEDGRNTKPIPVFYVSESAAAIRDANRHPDNGLGVVSGWYACASPGRFVIAVIPISNSFSAFTKTLLSFAYVNGEKHHTHILCVGDVSHH